MEVMEGLGKILNTWLERSTQRRTAMAGRTQHRFLQHQGCTNSSIMLGQDIVKHIRNSTTDRMALAAVEALRAEGRAGKVPVTGIDGIQLAVEAVLKGEMAGTVAWDPFWQGGMGLSIGYHAKTGTFDPAKEPKEHREFYGTGVTITSENAQSFYDANIKAEPTLDWNDIWGRASGQIQYS